MPPAPLDKCLVTGPVLKPDGTPCFPATITFTLSRRDRDDGVTIMPDPLEIDVDADGNFNVELWPNAEGQAGTFYSASVQLGARGRTRTRYPAFNLVVPVAPTANLADITELVPPAKVDDARAAVILAEQAVADARAIVDGAVAEISAAVQPVADNLAEVVAVADAVGEVVAVADDLAAVRTVAAREAEVAIVAGRDTDIGIVADAVDDVEDVAGGIADVSLAAENMALIQAAPGHAEAAETARGEAVEARNEARDLAEAADVAKIVWRGPYAAETAYAARDAVSFGNSSWIAKAETTGNAPPALPSTGNDWWDLMASRGDAYETYGVSIYRTAGIALGGYYAERSASASSTQAKLVAEIIAGDVGAEVDFYVEVDGVMAHGPLTVAMGAPVALSGLAIAIGAGATVSFVVARMTGNVTDFFAKTYGAMA
jgi:hypothetical protein